MVGTTNMLGPKGMVTVERMFTEPRRYGSQSEQTTKLATQTKSHQLTLNVAARKHAVCVLVRRIARLMAQP